MKTTKITTGFSSLSDGQLEILAQAVATAMSGNKNFPEPAPALADLNNGIQQFSEGLSHAKSRDKVKVAVKNQLRENLELLLTHLSQYCSFIAKGDRAMLSSSGFALKAENNTVKKLGNPENFSVEIGRKTGEALAFINPVANAKSYLFRWGVAPIVNDNWFNDIHSEPRFTITGLVPATTYSFQIGVAGSKGQTVYTDIITKMVV